MRAHPRTVHNAHYYFQAKKNVSILGLKLLKTRRTRGEPGRQLLVFVVGGSIHGAACFRYKNLMRVLAGKRKIKMKKSHATKRK